MMESISKTDSYGQRFDLFSLNRRNQFWKLIPSLARYLPGVETGEPRPSKLSCCFANNQPALAKTTSDFAMSDRSDLKPARTSSEKSCGCSQAAKCPPFSTLL